MRASSIKVAVALAAAVVIVCAGARPVRAADAPSTMAKVGAVAPAVVGKSTNSGKIEDFDLSKAVADGAVVLYFFPKAFTEG